MIRRIYAAAALLLAALSLAPAVAQVAPSSITVKDGTGASQSLGTVTCRTGVQCYEHGIIDTTGAQIDPATKQGVAAVVTALGSPFQTGGVIGNTAFGISGPLPAGTNALGTVSVTTLPALPTGANTIGSIANITGTVPLPAGAATQTTLASILTTLGAPAQAGGNIGNITGTISLPTGAATSANQTTLNGYAGTLAGTVAAAGSPAPNAQTVQPGTGSKFDTVVQGVAANRSVVIGFSSTASSATSASTSLPVTVTSTFTNQAGAVSGIPMVGQIVSGSGITAGTTITAVTGSAGSYTLTLSQAATLASGATVTSAGPQQVMAANTSRRGVQQQNQGTGDCYQNGLGSAIVGPDSLLIAARNYYESSPVFVGQGAISDICTVPATPVYAREF